MTAMTSPASDPQVPGAGFKYPVPSTVETAKAKRGFPLTGAVAISLDGFIGFPFASTQGATVRFRNLFLVENRVGHDVFFRRPCAQVEQPATFRAERKLRVLVRVRLFFADGASVFHGEENVLPQRAQGSKRLEGALLPEDPQGRTCGNARQLFCWWHCGDRGHRPNRWPGKNFY